MVAIPVTLLTERPRPIGTRVNLRDPIATTGRCVPYGPGDTIREVQTYPTEAVKLLPALSRCLAGIGR